VTATEEHAFPVSHQPIELLKAALGFALRGHDGREVCHALIDCDVAVTVLAEPDKDGQPVYDVILTAPQKAYDLLAPPSKQYLGVVFDFCMTSPAEPPYFNSLHVHLGPDASLMKVIPLPGNQALGGPRKVTWNQLHFRSETELRLAQALDEVGVMFLPNCSARLGNVEARRRLEPDFLICHEGRWGVLEAHGSEWHPPERKVEEEERARTFRRHGIRVVEHYDAGRCFTEPREVVADFLRLLERNG
jgi:hypothetical protein